ncbi:MAG: ribonuclease III [bacterium]|nr:ribonuclease III [bacterium]
MNFDTFEKKIGIVFADKDLLHTAFTHRSYLNEHRGTKTEHNERLEFLGDAVLELLTTEFLFKKYPHKAEGDLTMYRAGLVNAVTLAGVAEGLGMNGYMLLSKGEAKDTGRAREVILANAIEALIGALYLDGGYAKAGDFVSRFVLSLTDQIVAEGKWLDAKSHFQEKAQDIASVTPLYETVRETGPDHDKHFTVAVFIGREKAAEGNGKSKQEAEQAAAAAALKAKQWD